MNEKFNKASELKKSIVEQLKEFWVNEVQSMKDLGHNYVPGEGQFRASQLPNCARKNILSKMPNWIELDVVEETINYPTALGANVAGQSIHEYMQKTILDNSKRVLAVEPHVVKLHEKGFSIEGHIDLILMLDEVVIVDIKSFEEKENYDIRNFMPSSRYLDQLAIYSWITNIRNAAILYISRNKFGPEFYEMDDLDNRINNMLNKAAMLYEHEKNHTLPPVLERELKWDKSLRTKILKRNWECGFCPFENYCEIELKKQEEEP